MDTPYKRIHVIINPAAGHDEPILNTLNKVFHQYEIDWHARVTHRFGDATRFAKEALADGVDLVVGYGGDGTQLEVLNGVMGSNTPMAILPGGTGNAMTFELNIPHKLEQAAELICQSHNLRSIDVAQIGDKYFMLRLYTGVEESDRASREMKDRYGLLAYAADTLNVIKNPPHACFQLTIDGQEIEEEGFICFILNAGSFGGFAVPTNIDIDVSDGLLDVLIINNDLQSVRATASFMLNVGTAKANVLHWQGREVSIKADPVQPVWVDGESYGETPFTAKAIHKAVQVVVP
jgi:YegS/Rv2252/BmrU family lipid kinase